MNVGLVVHDMSNNALGRAFSLALVIEELGWAARVVGPSSAGLWNVMAETQFATLCEVASEKTELTGFARWSDVLVCVKALPESLGLTMSLGRTYGLPAILDMDDPDIAVRRAHAGRLSRRHPFRALRFARETAALARAARQLPLSVSNPFLQDAWGGTLVPHARAPRRAPRTDSRGPVVRVGFVGTPRRHKGLDLLRAAVAPLAPAGFRLVVTADKPDDPNPWEEWVGMTTFEEGLRLVDSFDVVAVPSLDEGYAPQQFPVKLVDAMMAARPIVASDLPPIRWGVGDAAVLVRPGSQHSLEEALRQLSDPRTRARLGQMAQRRGVEMFSPGAVAPPLRDLLLSVAHGR